MKTQTADVQTPTYCALRLVVSSLALLFASLAIVAPAFADRTVVRVEDGITVEEESAPGRTLPILFGTTTMPATPEQIAAWVTAPHTYVDWQHNCEEARALPQPDGSELTYNRIGSPWPVSDRDVVLRSTRTNFEDGRIRIEFQSTKDAKLAVPSGVVRMPRLIGSYDLTPEASGTKVVYTVDSDPGGSLPTWLVRQASKDLPYLTLKNLQARVASGPPPSR
jgi:hypothetical protein